MLVIRNPALDDKSILKLVKSQLFPLTQKSFPSIKFNKDEIYKRLKKGTTYVIRCKGYTVGFVHLLVDGQTVWIDMLAVKPGHRRNGWGSLLMRKAERIGRRKKCDVSYLYVDKVNIKGQRFYRKQGYNQIYYESNMECYLYAKAL